MSYLDGATIWSATALSWLTTGAAGAQKGYRIEPQNLKDQLYTVMVGHDSTASAVSVYLEDWDNRYGAFYRTSFNVPAATTAGTTAAAVNVEGWLLGDGGRVTFAADTSLTSTSQAFTIFATIRKF